MFILDQSIKRRVVLVVVYVVLNCLYIFLGGVVMYFLEHDYEVRHLKEMSDYVELVGLNTTQADHLEELGVCTFPNHLYPHWTFAGSCFYAFTVITTIGYGLYAPVTLSGRIFTSFYAVPGISIVGLLLQNLAGLMAEIIQALMNRHNKESEEEIVEREMVSEEELSRVDAGRRAVCTDRQQFLGILTALRNTPPEEELVNYVFEMLGHSSHTFTNREFLQALSVYYMVRGEVPEQSRSSLRYILLTFIGVVAWMAVWGVGFAAIESWTNPEGCWFAFVSLTTIGFGDFVPNTTLGRVCGFLFMAPGLGLMGAFFGALSNCFVRWRFFYFKSLLEKGTVSYKMMEAQGFSVFKVSEKKGKRVSEDDEDISLIPLNERTSTLHSSTRVDTSPLSSPNTPPVRRAARRDFSRVPLMHLGSSGMAYCPSGHQLVIMPVGCGAGESGSSEHTCDMCHRAFVNTRVARCGRCDYDLCLSCNTRSSRRESNATEMTAAEGQSPRAPLRHDDGPTLSRSEEAQLTRALQRNDEELTAGALSRLDDGASRREVASRTSRRHSEASTFARSHSGGYDTVPLGSPATSMVSTGSGRDRMRPPRKRREQASPTATSPNSQECRETIHGMASIVLELSQRRSPTHTHTHTQI
eukprot:Sspe_Gene.19751::Locus_7208_Transcript_2_2_Confidence_0.600_Length_1973::g.19751::m.19751